MSADTFATIANGLASLALAVAVVVVVVLLILRWRRDYPHDDGLS